MINVGAKVWIDGTRIDRGPGSSNADAAGELSSHDGMVELTVPIDIGALGKTVTVRFPMSALIRLNQA
ncbi:hypothetical protein [Mycolicibacterium sphagni]|uniref:Uncharacterized protein n=1 Tax=Mycolicibacterium sphagni TaxID=1786 RepID=A0ABX2JZZ2_9MYCO|nr:hypothetical protein [Mycolicibacterium sphagni]NTY62193.1 hypothetical protein [Mycolicibacterium sphagni]